MTRWDLGIFRWINHWPEEWSPFFVFMSTALDDRVVRFALLAVLVVMGIRSPKARTAILLALIAFPLANEVTDFLKASFPDPRPFQVLTDTLVRVGRSDSMGTASAHSANTAAVATLMTFHLKWWATPWVFISVFTGLSRIYGGAHFPGQVILGWTVGIAMACLVQLGYVLILRERKKRKEQAN